MAVASPHARPRRRPSARSARDPAPAGGFGDAGPGGVPLPLLLPVEEAHPETASRTGRTRANDHVRPVRGGAGDGDGAGGTRGVPGKGPRTPPSGEATSGRPAAGCRGRTAETVPG